ncbi:MAG: hypothetical protein QNJ22_22660 [Desulfosarcinaceae bacterium]|nr:hypothetical protein [Desulfosarcinaceae bacterium]
MYNHFMHKIAMKWKIVILSVVIIILACMLSWPYLYKILDEKYQRAHDPIRVDHINEISDIAFAYSQEVGHPPLYDLVLQQNKPFMVLIGRSDKEEDQFAKLEVLNRGALFINSNRFEKILSEGLSQTIILPRDPQTVATYAPNIYVYYVSVEQFCIAAHLYFATAISQPYSWEGGTFHSHALCYSKKK